MSYTFTEGFDANNRRHLAKLGQDILSLSTNANIVSKMTAFVAIDKESKKQVEGVMVKRPCPVPLATSEMLASPGHRKRKRGGGGYRGGRGGGSVSILDFEWVRAQRSQSNHVSIK